MDDAGFLTDKLGNIIMDDDGQPMRLDEEELENIKENGLYEELEKTMIE